MSNGRSIHKPSHTTGSKAPKSVPFVELHDGRLQGVVSSSSSKERVYVSYIEATTGDYYCRTNNNRQCGGLHGGRSGRECKHIERMVEEALVRYSPATVRTYLGLEEDGEQGSAREMLDALDGDMEEAADSEIFTRFLYYLEDLETAPTNDPVPEMAWFVS